MIVDRLLRLAVVVCLTGCAGARTNVVADGAEYPISLSRAVRDADGVIVSSQRVTKVGSFSKKTNAWGMFYSAIKLTPKTDISGAINEQVAKVGGDAVVNVRIKNDYCPNDFFIGFNMLPFWPGCSQVKIEGDIIKVQR